MKIADAEAHRVAENSLFYPSAQQRRRGKSGGEREDQGK